MRLCPKGRVFVRNFFEKKFPTPSKNFIRGYFGRKGDVLGRFLSEYSNSSVPHGREGTLASDQAPPRPCSLQNVRERAARGTQKFFTAPNTTLQKGDRSKIGTVSLLKALGRGEVWRGGTFSPEKVPTSPRSFSPLQGLFLPCFPKMLIFLCKQPIFCARMRWLLAKKSKVFVENNQKREKGVDGGGEGWYNAQNI